jgi:hypothetical protein
MTTQAGLLSPNDQVAGLAVLMVYARADLAVCSRVLQTLVTRRIAVERLIGDLSRFDHSHIRGLEEVRGPVMRISLVVSLHRSTDLERLVKLLNRVIDVFKVEHTFRL